MPLVVEKSLVFKKPSCNEQKKTKFAFSLKTPQIFCPSAGCWLNGSFPCVNPFILSQVALMNKSLVTVVEVEFF